MIGGEVVVKGASKKIQSETKKRAGGDVITKGPTEKTSKLRQNKAGKKKSRT